ncbi:hypothetical protein EDB84DRAFT_1674281 [Lactarius hengduanensis]|nr:hypothetical protein EDB84DRAFT_1674281 [Lactarius hengduanensis]
MPRTTTLEESPTFGPPLGRFCLENSLPQEVLPAIKDKLLSRLLEPSTQDDRYIPIWGWHPVHLYSERSGSGMVLLVQLSLVMLPLSIRNYYSAVYQTSTTSPWSNVADDPIRKQHIFRSGYSKGTSPPTNRQTGAREARGVLIRERERMCEYTPGPVARSICEVLVEFCSRPITGATAPS